MTIDTTGWTFADSNAIDWQPIGDKVAMKMLGGAGGTMLAMFRFDAGYVGGTHHHEQAEFTYVLDGSVLSNGVEMHSGHSYAVEAGTDHEEFRTDSGCTIVSVFKAQS
jgi:quercetin dioxygenase-like cupin family protein